MSSPVEETKKVIILVSKDGKKFEVEKKSIVLSALLKDMLDNNWVGDVIPLPNVDANTLTKVINYCERHTVRKEAVKDLNNQELKKFDADFVDVDFRTLVDLINAANYLDMKELLDLCCQTVANMIKDESPERIRKIFGFENDFSEEEEKKIHNENAWIDEESNNKGGEK